MEINRRTRQSGSGDVSCVSCVSCVSGLACLIPSNTSIIKADIVQSPIQAMWVRSTGSMHSERSVVTLRTWKKKDTGHIDYLGFTSSHITRG